MATVDLATGPREATVETTMAQAVATIAVRGDLDAAAIAEVAEAIARAVSRGHGDVVLDLGDVAFMDVTGLEFIIRSRRRLARDGGTLRVTRPRTEIQRLLAVCGIVDLDLSSPPIAVSRAIDRQALALACETDARGYGT